MRKPLRVLIVKDSEEDTRSLLHDFHMAGFEPSYERADSLITLTSALRSKPWDLVICDHDMPAFGVMTLKLLDENHLDLPVVIGPGQSNKSAAVVTMKHGAYGYIRKDNLKGLIPTIEAELEKTRARRERRQAEKTLRESETKYRQLVENLQEGICTIDRDGFITFVNPRLAAMLAYSPEEMQGKAFFSFMDAGSVQRCQHNLKLRGEGRQAEHDFEFRRKDGTSVFTHIETSLVMGDDGDYNGALVAIEDITERKEAQELFKALAESSPVGIYILQDGKFQYVNPQFQSATGYSERELLRIHSLDMVHPEDKETVRRNAISMLKGGRSSPYEYRVIHKSGKVRWVMETVASFTYFGKRAVLGNYMDITESKNLQRKMYEYEELDKLKTNLLSTVSHELRTPLATIKGYSTMLLDYDRRLAGSEKHQYLESIDAATDRLTELIDHLLDMSRLEAGLLKLDRSPTDVSRLLDEVVAQAKLRLRHHELLLEVSKSLPLANVDARRIRQVIENLVDNADKYSPDGTRISVSARCHEAGILVSVADRGIGIPTDDLDKVFNRFYRIEQRLNPDVKGFGLGLAICRGFMEAHGSRIWVESQEGKGSTFYVTLPLVESEDGNGKKKRVVTNNGSGR